MSVCPEQTRFRRRLAGLKHFRICITKTIAETVLLCLSGPCIDMPGSRQFIAINNRQLLWLQL